MGLRGIDGVVIRIATNGQSLPQAEAGAGASGLAVSVCYPPCFF